MTAFNYAVVTGDELGMEVEFFTHRYQAENWSEEFDGTLVDVLEAQGIGAMLQDRIDRAVDKYECADVEHVEI